MLQGTSIAVVLVPLASQWVLAELVLRCFAPVFLSEAQEVPWTVGSHLRPYHDPNSETSSCSVEDRVEGEAMASPVPNFLGLG